MVSSTTNISDAFIPSRWDGLRSALLRAGRPLWRLIQKYRVLILAIGHLVIFGAAFLLAFLLRFDFEIPDDYVRRMLQGMPLVMAVKLIVFYAFGHYHGWWRYVTLADLSALMRAVGLCLLLVVLFNHYLLDNLIPKGVVILDGITCLLFVGALRASWRMCRESTWLANRNRSTAIMVGADHNNGVLAHHINAHPELPFRVVGFLSKSTPRNGARLGGIPIMGTFDDVVKAIETSKAKSVLVQDKALTGVEMRNLVDACEQNDLELKMVPSVIDHLAGNESIPIRDVEINDLLGRRPVNLDMRTISKQLAASVVLVTGAGGSIGSEICRQIMQFGPRKLILVDHGENALFLIHGELQRFDDASMVEIIPCVADVLDNTRMRGVFEEYSPEYVYHAAAYKHVGLMETNVAECVQNNVFGSKRVADLAHEHAAKKFVLISTDKAVHPTSVMGASKQIAERYIHSMDQESDTSFVVVRFGNVLGSNGSVVPIFKEQIRRGGPVTITDKRMTRFFMTIPEASQLVLQAGSMGKGGEIFVLEMGEQVRIEELARDLIRLSGLHGDAIDVVYVGARPGEKLYEQLYFDEEQSLETSHPKVRAAYHRPYSVAEVLDSIYDLGNTLAHGDDAVRRKLKEIVPEYTLPDEVKAQLAERN